MSKNDLINIFWTGGWDSTYRILYLTIVENKSIQPYYIKGFGRVTQDKEISTMTSIKNEIEKKFPNTIGLIKDTKFMRADEITTHSDIKNSFIEIQKEYCIGNQYYIMAECAKIAQINDIEVCIQHETALNDYISPNDPVHIDKRFSHKSIFKIFGNFSFPILNLKKREMAKTSDKYNFLDILNMSWFCHHPINNKPCGICLPCMIVMEEKMYSRMPLISRIRYYISPKRHIKSILNKYPRYNYIAKSLFGRVT